MQLTIHRGAKQIGGCVTELSYGSHRVFIDIGENLRESDAPLLPIEGLTMGDVSYSALFLTHYHGDHMGRLPDVLPGVPVYMGDTAKELQLNYARRVEQHYPGYPALIERVSPFTPGKPVQIGEIIVTPLMIDHSAFDAYMFLVEAGGVRVLHTGDFRLHGPRGGKTLRMLRQYAKNINYLICEGTMSREPAVRLTEWELGQEARRLMKDNKYVFVLCASTNIDRIAEFYHANPTGRLFICDAYQKSQLEIIRQGHGQLSPFYDFQHIYSYAHNLDGLMRERGFYMLIKQNAQCANLLERYRGESLLIYSMWSGYLKGEAKNEGLAAFLHSYPLEFLHSSGHASPEDVVSLIDCVNPRNAVIPIHTDAPDTFKELLPGREVCLLVDGERFELKR